MFFILHTAFFGLHYLFASQTAHIGALYAAFLAMMLAAGEHGTVVFLVRYYPVDTVFCGDATRFYFVDCALQWSLLIEWLNRDGQGDSSIDKQEGKPALMADTIIHGPWHAGHRRHHHNHMVSTLAVDIT